MRLIIFLTIFLTCPPAMAQIDKSLQNQLVKMAQQNQEVRQSLDKYAPENVPATLQSVATQIDNLHVKTLKEIVTLHGWPSIKQVGGKGSQAMFVMVRHSKDLAFQQDMLPLIIQSYLDKEGIAGQDVARYTDNVSIKLGKKQVFGTQVQMINGVVIFAPIENEDSVDLLRAQMGMQPLAEYKKTLEVLYDIQ